MYQVTEIHYGLVKIREFFVPKALNFLTKHASVADNIEDYEGLQDNLDKLSNLNTFGLKIEENQSKPELVDEHIGELLSTQIEESEEMLIQLLESVQLGNMIKKMILDQFFSSVAYYTFSDLFNKSADIIKKWLNEPDSSILGVSELWKRYLEANNQIAIRIQKHENYKATGYWRD